MAEIETKTEDLREKYESVKRELGKLKRDVIKAQQFYRTERTELKLPRAGIDAYGAVIPYADQPYCGDLLHFIDFAQDMGLEGKIQHARRMGHEGLVKRLKRHRRRLGFLAIDAMGHNEGSAFEATILYNKTLPAMEGDLDHNGQVTPRVFRTISNSIRDNKEGHMRTSTMMYGEVTEIPGQNKASLRIVRNGHPLPLILRAATGKFDEALRDKWRSQSNLPITLQRSHGDHIYRVDETTLNVGDTVLVYTDGLEEYRTEFPQKTEEVINANRQESSEETVTEIVQSLLGKKPRAGDDTTIGVIKYAGSKAPQ